MGAALACNAKGAFQHKTRKHHREVERGRSRPCPSSSSLATADALRDRISSSESVESIASSSGGTHCSPSCDRAGAQRRGGVERERSTEVKRSRGQGKRSRETTNEFNTKNRHIDNDRHTTPPPFVRACGRTCCSWMTRSASRSSRAAAMHCSSLSSHTSSILPVGGQREVRREGEREVKRERERQTQTQVHMHTCTHKAHKTSGASRGAHWSKREQLGLVAPLLVQAIKMLCFALQILKL